MKTATYTYNKDKDYTAELQDENLSIADCINQLNNEKIDFFKVQDETGIFEITLSSTNELITNGYELF